MSDEILSVEEAMATGNAELIDKAMAATGTHPYADEQDEVAAESGAKAVDDSEKVNGNSSENSVEQPADNNGDPSGQEVKVVKSKDGKHEIPYDVLESARLREQKARQQAADLQRQLEEANSKIQATEQQIANAKQRAESSGMDTEAMFNDPDAITENELKEIEEDYGSDSPTAKLARQMFRLQRQQESNAEKASQTEESSADAHVQEATAAFQANPDLTSWNESDPDRWEMAQFIDSKLQSDPEWKSKPVAERFAEVAKRTKHAFGDPLGNPAEEKAAALNKAKTIIDKTTQDTPDSLSDLGQAPSAEKSLTERLEAMTPAQLEAEMANMTPAQIQQILNSY